jgi:uncharacterized protein YegP (UPF0339 family)
MKPARLEVYRTTSLTRPVYYWRLRAGNGRIVCDSAESYTRRADCIRAAMRAQRLMTQAEVAE